MSQDPKPTTTEDLRRLTGAPKADEPLVSETEFPTRVVPSERPPWTLPIPKLGIIGIALMPVFILAASLLMHRGQSSQTAQSDSKGSGITTDAQLEGVLKEIREENAKLRTDAALEGQKLLASKPAANHKSKAPANSQSPKLTQKVVTSPSSAIQRVATPTAIASAPIPPIRRAETVASPQLIRSAPISTALPKQRDFDPREQWQQLAKLGSYGSIASEQSSTVDETRPVQARATLVQDVAMSADPKPETTPDVIPDPITQVSQNPEIIAERNSQAAVEVPEEAEDRILSDSSSISSHTDRSETSRLIAGATSTGVVASPIVLDATKRNSSRSNAVPNRFPIVLSTPLTTSTGEVAFPAGTRLLAQVDELLDAGQVELSVTTAVWTEAGRQKEVRLPAGVIQIRGENGKPLMAEASSDRKRKMTRMQAGQFLLGAVQRSAGLLTRSNSQIQTGNGTTIITEKDPRPNILAGALEGGATQVLETMNERNRQAIEKLQNQPEVRVIQAGQPVEIFVNQSMLLPTSS